MSRKVLDVRIMADVYLIKLQQPSDAELAEAGQKIFTVFQDFFQTGDKVALKVHFGERASQTRLSPVLVKAIYEQLQPRVASAALTDCNVLYKGDRSFGHSHQQLAHDNGFNFAPVVIADGEKGENEYTEEVDLKHFQKVRLGGALQDYNAVLAISHFTGHSAAGIGAALKNVGMGFGSKAGKLEMHQAFNLKVNPAVCQGCFKCGRECPASAIFLANNKARIDEKKCISCGRCISECPFGAMEIPWGDSSSADLQEKIVEYAVGALKGRKAFFVNVLLGITSRCDCMREYQTPVMRDIGILASNDIVAIDQASLDLAGRTYFTKDRIDPEEQIKYAFALGLGRRTYDLKELT